MTYIFLVNKDLFLGTFLKQNKVPWSESLSLRKLFSRAFSIDVSNRKSFWKDHFSKDLFENKGS